MLMGIPARRFAWILLIGSFLLRLAAVLALRDPTQFHGPELGLDAYHYDELARNLVDGNGYTIGEQPTAFRPPGFPFFLALVYALSAKSYLAAYLGFCLLGALAVYWTWRAASKLTDEHTARIAALLLAVYPPHLYFATIFATENLFVGLLALCLMLATRLREGSWRLQLGFGLCLGAMVLTRPFALLAVPLLLLPLLCSRTEWRRAALLVAGLALLLVPWTLRNSRALGHPVLLTTSSGAVLWGSSNDRVLNEERFRGGWVASEQLPGWEQVRAIPDERERDALQAQWGRAWLREHVRDVPKLLWWRLERFCMPDRDSDNGTYVLLQWLGTTPFLVLFVIGILWRIRFHGRGGAWWFADALMLACLATALLFYGAPRFRDGNAPILVIYAALPLAALLRRISPCGLDASSCGSTRAGSPRAP